MVPVITRLGGDRFIDRRFTRRCQLVGGPPIGGRGGPRRVGKGDRQVAVYVGAFISLCFHGHGPAERGRGRGVAPPGRRTPI